MDEGTGNMRNAAYLDDHAISYDINVVTRPVEKGEEKSEKFSSGPVTFWCLVRHRSNIQSTPDCVIFLKKSKIQKFSLKTGPTRMFFPGLAVTLDVSSGVIGLEDGG